MAIGSKYIRVGRNFLEAQESFRRECGSRSVKGVMSGRGMKLRSACACRRRKREGPLQDNPCQKLHPPCSLL